MGHKTTPKNFELFKKHVFQWLDHFGLKDWEIIISHEIPDECKESLGACATNLESRFCNIYLNSEWDRKITDELIKNIAFHEVCELLLAEFDAIARTRSVSTIQLDSARHGVIARLYNSIAGEKYRK